MAARTTAEGSSLAATPPVLIPTARGPPEAMVNHTLQLPTRQRRMPLQVADLTATMDMKTAKLATAADIKAVVNLTGATDTAAAMDGTSL